MGATKVRTRQRSREGIVQRSRRPKRWRVHLILCPLEVCSQTMKSGSNWSRGVADHNFQVFRGLLLRMTDRFTLQFQRRKNNININFSGRTPGENPLKKNPFPSLPLKKQRIPNIKFSEHKLLAVPRVAFQQVCAKNVNVVLAVPTWLIPRVCAFGPQGRQGPQHSFRTKRTVQRQSLWAGSSWEMRGPDAGISLTPTLGCAGQKLSARHLNLLFWAGFWPGCPAIWVGTSQDMVCERDPWKQISLKNFWLISFLYRRPQNIT